jgi:hypothetical protein
MINRITLALLGTTIVAAVATAITAVTVAAAFMAGVCIGGEILEDKTENTE